MSLSRFHPITQRWFQKTLGEPTAAQSEGWTSIAAGRHTLIAAPTGSGKTLAAFLTSIDELFQEGLPGPLPDEVRVVYVSPLKALSADIHKNLAEPREGIRRIAAELGLDAPRITSGVRTGDTTSSERASMLKTPPHILVTTPESLYLLLTAERSREMLRTVRTVIVDEIHAVIGTRRGAHLALTLERLQQVAEKPLLRLGLSATQKPIEEVARFLVGTREAAKEGGCVIVDAGHQRAMDLTLEMPRSPLDAVMSHEVWEEYYDRLTELIETHKTTLVFVNTRRMAERVARHLSHRIGETAVTAHHGSLSKENRLDAEGRLKGGQLKALVATASLELGIDIGHVDLVCQIGSPHRIATLLQRVGRSGHTISGLPKGRIFPASRDDLVECTALLRSVRRGELDRIVIHDAPLDVLAQQVVAETACRDYSEDELFAFVRGAWPYRDLARKDLDDVVKMTSEGFATKRGRRGALVHRDEVNGMVRGRRGARMLAISSGGAIPEVADYKVVLEGEETFIGTLNEDFAIESSSGDIFQLGNASWQVVQVQSGVVRVSDAKGAPPTIPFWLGEAPARSDELSRAVSELRGDFEKAGARGDEAGPRAEGQGQSEQQQGELAGTVGSAVAAPDPIEPSVLGPVSSALGPASPAPHQWLLDQTGIPESAALEVAAYLDEAQRALGVLPTQETLVLERFFDESGGMQLVLHSPYGSRINKAWGLALRKRFCRQFNFELQAAATEEGVLLSLGPQHSFPLADVFRYLHPATSRDVLVQAFLDAPVFQTRWRWNTTISLAVPRNRNGKKVPPQLQRMMSDDLMAAVFPDAAACFENIAGDRQLPDHPLVNQVLRDCLEEAMDFEGLAAVLTRIHNGEIRCVARDTTEPSPLAHELLTAKPYAFLDDAPLEERRTQAVFTRRAGDVSSNDLGALDAGAVERVRAEERPDPRDADELHDALLTFGFLTDDDAADIDPVLFTQLVHARRADRVQSLWIAAERLPELLALHPDAKRDPRFAAPPSRQARVWTREEAAKELIRGRIAILGPTTAIALARSLFIAEREADQALLALESEGAVLRGQFEKAGAEGQGPREQQQGELAGTVGNAVATPDPIETPSRGPQPSALGPVSSAPCPSPPAPVLQWCDRRLLARIHRYTLNRLRAEIEPVGAADFMRFLFAWQHVSPSTRLSGTDGLQAVIAALDGYELAASAWERSVLPARMDHYEPAMLDMLCLTGEVGWARLSMPIPLAAAISKDVVLPSSSVATQASVAMLGPRLSASHDEPQGRASSSSVGEVVSVSRIVGATPIALFLREHGEAWRTLRGHDDRDTAAIEATLGDAARRMLETLRLRGASFSRDLAANCDLDDELLGHGIGELVSAGLISSDGFAGLRTLVAPQQERRPNRGARPSLAGRWSLLSDDDGAPTPTSSDQASSRTADRERRAREQREAAAREAASYEEAVEIQARALLQRYGIVFRRLLTREANAAPWRELARVYRRLEARGEIRGGRFVTGMSGEQFALPEAVERMREIRREKADDELLVISAADPLNLTGILTAGEKLRAVASNRIAYRNGMPLSVMEGDCLRPLQELDAIAAADVAAALAGRRVPVVRGFVGRAAAR